MDKWIVLPDLFNTFSTGLIKENHRAKRGGFLVVTQIILVVLGVGSPLLLRSCLFEVRPLSFRRSGSL